MFVDLWKGERVPVGEVLKLLTKEDLSAIAKGRSRRQGDQEYEGSKPEFHA
jgi:hypothetical protein